jgi:hypothetical protein
MAKLRKLTEKQEEFCLGLAKGMSLSGAYRAAYDVGRQRDVVSVHHDAADLAKLPHVKARIASLKHLVRKKVDKLLIESAVATTPQVAVDMRAAAALEQTIVDKAWIEANLITVVKNGLSDETICDKEGTPTGEVRSANLAAVNRALELLGKERGMFIETRRNISDPLDALTHAQVKELLELMDESDAARSPAVRNNAARGPGRATH